VHTTARVKALSSELKIKLHYIPAGKTDQLQPLDIKIFGVLKGYSKAIFINKRNSFYDDPFENKLSACQSFLTAWEKLLVNSIKDSFMHFQVEE
jgi:hypothetical protein